MNLSETAIKGSTVESHSKKLSYHSISSFKYYFFFNMIAVMTTKIYKAAYVFFGKFKWTQVHCFDTYTVYT